MNNALRILFVSVALALPVGFAQQFYLGATAGTPLSADINSITDSFETGAQLGIDFLPSFGVRVSAEGNLPRGDVKLGSFDTLFRFYLPMSPNSFYVGGGADAFFSSRPNSLDDVRRAPLAAHAVAGAEVRFGRFGLFAEAQPSYLVGQNPSSRDAYYLRGRGGINFHF